MPDCVLSLNKETGIRATNMQTPSMNFRTGITAFVFGGIVCSVALAKPNVVILFTDDQGTLDAGCYGSKDLHTPNIDQLAQRGVRFTQAYAHTVCCPARAALMTGRHPQRGGVNSWTQGNMKGKDGLNMALSEVTLAEALKGGGYRTALFGKWHLGSHRDHGPKKQGFDEFFGIRNGFIDNYNHYFLHGNGYHDLYEGTEEVWRKGEYFPELVTDRALEFIEKNAERPFFLFVGFNIPHYPEQALEQHSKRFENLPEPRRSYAAVMATTDHYIGKVLDKLDDVGVGENTIVIFQSDNGHSRETSHIRVENHSSGLPKGHNYGANGGGGNTGKWIGHKGTFLEGGIRTPAILSYPAKVPKGEVRDQIVTAMDWFPTVLELCGIAKPEDLVLDGKSVGPILKSASAKSPHEVLHFQWQNRWAVREGSWKLIGNPKTATLHNLDDAKPEAKNHAAEHPEIVVRLRNLHEKWVAEVIPAKK